MASPDAGYADSYSGEPWSSGSASGMEPSECSFATQAPGSSDTVTVSAHSAVKDAAGAVAKVLERRGSCLLLALRRRGETDAECSHIAAKTLAVSRFYINTSSAAADQQAGGDGSSMREVTFLPFRRGGAPDGASSSASTAASTVGASGSESFGFMVFAQPQQELEVALPPARHQSAQQALPAAAAAGARPQEAPQVLKAAAGTDVNKLANAVIHHVLERGRCVLQLAGAGACHTALRALARARARLASKFDAGMLAAAAFNTEDTSGSLGRASVFLRIDVVRCALAQMEGAAWALHGGDELRLASA